MPSQRQKLQTTLVQFYQQPVAKVSLELFMSVGAVMFFAVFAIRPTLLTMADLIKEIEDKQELVQQFNQKIAALSSVQTEYNSAQTRLTLLDEAIPPTPRFEEAIKIIERLASDNRLVISSMRVPEIPQEPEEEVEFAKKERVSLPITVTVVGDYPAIRQFVEDIQENRRSFVVDTIIFSVSDQREQKKLSATITLNMQYYGKSADKAAGSGNRANSGNQEAEWRKQSHNLEKASALSASDNASYRCWSSH